jgi:hypothetical protein
VRRRILPNGAHLPGRRALHHYTAASPLLLMTWLRGSLSAIRRIREDSYCLLRVCIEATVERRGGDADSLPRIALHS